jgi:hypothetical protein
MLAPDLLARVAALDTAVWPNALRPATEGRTTPMALSADKWKAPEGELPVCQRRQQGRNAWLIPA